MIGVFGGTFDPVHLGHLRTALDVQHALQLQQVRFIPCANPPHRAPPTASGPQRLAMLRLAVAAQHDFVVDTRELDRGGVSYMVDTLQSLRDEYTAVPLCLILGMDAMRHFDSWQRYLDILALAHVVVMQRPGNDLDQLRSHPKVYALIEQHRASEVTDLQCQSAGLIWLQTVTQLAISATAIRAMCARGEAIHYLVPDPVREYIHQHKLYCERGAIAN
jgi:nicotinate-nucleotide adenylyltransferase